MFEPSLGQNFMAIIGLPLAFWLTALGTGLAVERLARAELTNGLLLPLGFAGAVVLVYPVYALGGSDVIPVILLALVSAAGLIFARGGVRSRLNPGLPGLAGLAVYVLFMLPVLVEGHWLWLGYNFDNDTSVQFLLTAAMKAHGTQLLSASSTAGRVVDEYFNTGYPIGAHALLATLSGLLHSDPAVVYQGFLSAMAATIAVTVASASSRLVGSRRAAVIGFTAACANLFFQFVYQGTIKEVATALTTVGAFALAAEAVRLRRPYAGVVIAAVPLAATLCTYGVAGSPYVLATIGAVALQLVVVERRLPRPSWLGPSALGAVLILALSVPAVVEFSTLFNIAQSVVGTSNPAGSPFGTLVRALPLSQMTGVWLNGDFRYPIPPGSAATLTTIAAAVILLALIPGVLWSLWKREPAPIFAVVTTGLVLLIIVPRVTPYGGGKLYAMGSPVVVWVAGIGLCVPVWRRLKVITIAVGAALALAIVASDMLGYHQDQTSPVNRMLAMEAVANRLAGRGSVLFNESDEFVKYFTRAADTNPAFDSQSPRQALLITSANRFNQFFDLDQETLPYVESFPLIVTRRSPIASRPPSNYKLIYTNEFYDAWSRQSAPKPLAHISLEGTLGAVAWQGAATPDCASVAALVKTAPRGTELVEAVVPPSTGFLAVNAPSRPPGWVSDPNLPGAVTPVGPGRLTQQLHVSSSGSYVVWVQGTFSRPVEVLVDGHDAGSADGLDSVDQWSKLGSIRLSRGRHTVVIVRGGGRVYPGDGSKITELGGVTLRKSGAEVLRTVPLARWRSLCGKPADWIELVKP